MKNSLLPLSAALLLLLLLVCKLERGGVVLVLHVQPMAALEHTNTAEGRVVVFKANILTLPNCTGMLLLLVALIVQKPQFV